jgi:hypothetical protein
LIFDPPKFAEWRRRRGLDVKKRNSAGIIAKASLGMFEWDAKDAKTAVATPMPGRHL